MGDKASTDQHTPVPDEAEAPRLGAAWRAPGTPDTPGEDGSAPDAIQSGPSAGGDHTSEEMPRIRLTRGRLLASIVFVVSTVAFLYFVLHKLLGLQQTWNRIQHGNAWWLGLAAILEVASFVGYMALFRAVFVRGGSRIGWGASLADHMAGGGASGPVGAGGGGGG